MSTRVARPGALLAVVAIAIAAIAAPTSADASKDVGTTVASPPVVSFTAPDSITEGEIAVFTFRRVGDLSDELAVNLDFFFQGQFLQSYEMPELVFAAGAAEAVFSIPTVDDGTPEPDGSIGIHLQLRHYHPDPNYPQPYQPQEPVYQQVTVRDND